MFRINLKMNPITASKIIGLRPALEAMAIRATEDPESVSDPEGLDGQLMTVVRALSKPNAGKFAISDNAAEG